MKLSYLVVMYIFISISSSLTILTQIIVKTKEVNKKQTTEIACMTWFITSIYVASWYSIYNVKIMSNCNRINGIRDSVPSLKNLIIQAKRQTYTPPNDRMYETLTLCVKCQWNSIVWIPRIKFKIILRWQVEV